MDLGAKWDLEALNSSLLDPNPIIWDIRSRLYVNAFVNNHTDMDMQFSFRLDKVVVDFYWSCAWISFSRSNISNSDFISIICEILSHCVLIELRLFLSWQLSLSSRWLMVCTIDFFGVVTKMGMVIFLY